MAVSKAYAHSNVITGMLCCVGCFTRCVFVFDFVLIYVQFEFIMKVINADDDFDDERKILRKAKFVSNERSDHDD